MRAMPNMAIRLLKSFEMHYGKTLVAANDLLQAHLMLQELDPAIEILKNTGISRH